MANSFGQSLHLEYQGGRTKRAAVEYNRWRSLQPQTVLGAQSAISGFKGRAGRGACATVPRPCALRSRAAAVNASTRFVPGVALEAQSNAISAHETPTH